MEERKMVRESPDPIAHILEPDKDGFFWDGRTELNLCELPIFIPYHVPKSKPQHVIESPPFRDRKTGKTVSRRITIYPSVKYGYPRMLDKRVLDGLTTLSHRKHRFEINRVHANRYELSQILQRDTGGKPMRELQESIRRMCQVNYTIEHAWYDKKTQTTTEVDDDFCILDRVQWRREKGKKGQYTAEEAEEAFMVFGDKLYQNLKAGNVRKIDFRVANSLRKPIAYSSYSLLAKRFWAGADEVDLDFEQYHDYHLALSPAGKLYHKKRAIKKGLAELEAHGIIAPMEDSERFYTDSKTRRTRIRFVREKRTQVQVFNLPPAPKQTELFSDNPLVSVLVDRGLKPLSAKQCVDNYDAEHIQACMELVDWKIEQGHNVPRPAGLLYKTITEGIIEQEGFTTQEQRREAATKEARRKAEGAELYRAADALPDDEKKAAAEELRSINRQLNQMPGGESLSIQREAWKLIPKTISSEFRKWRDQEGQDETKTVFVVAYLAALKGAMKDLNAPPITKHNS